MATRSEVGAHGETLAVRHLTGRGYAVRDRNWRHGRGELDIVAERDGTIVFVEVRARRGDGFGAPEETLTPSKRAKLVETAEAYLAEHGLDDADWRVDVIAIDLDARLRVTRLEHFENAVEG